MMFSEAPHGQVARLPPSAGSAILTARMRDPQTARLRRLRVRLGALAVAAVLCYGAAARADGSAGEILRVRVHSIIHPIAAEYLIDALAEADREDAAAVVVELDTPGGAMVSMREMTTAILSAKTPVIVYVAPNGAQAASAGFYILESADFAAMAPATNTGAAHPVGSGGETIKGVLGRKVEQDAAASIRALAAHRGRNVELAEAAVVKSRSFTAQEALDGRLIDVVAPSFAALVAALDGRSFEKPAGTERRLHLAGSVVRDVELPGFKGLLSRLADPNLASILLTLGLLGLYFELSHPGAVLPGVVGGICLLLAAFGLSLLPVSYVGVGLVLLAIVLFLAEVQATSYGALAVGGIISLVLGLAMLFKSPEPALQVSRSLILTLAAVAALVVSGAVTLAVRAFRTPVAVGRPALVGARATVRSPLDPAGKVFVQGEWWNAVSDQTVEAGQQVEITAVDGMTLRVRPIEPRS
jgi:membrane-bound serine protease (ClpP class)